MRRIWVRLQSKASQSAASGSFAPGRQLLLHDGGDDPLDDRRIGERLAEVVFGERHLAPSACPSGRAVLGTSLEMTRSNFRQRLELTLKASSLARMFVLVHKYWRIVDNHAFFMLTRILAGTQRQSWPLDGLGPLLVQGAPAAATRRI